MKLNSPLQSGHSNLPPVSLIWYIWCNWYKPDLQRKFTRYCIGKSLSRSMPRLQTMGIHSNHGFRTISHSIDVWPHLACALKSNSPTFLVGLLDFIFFYALSTMVSVEDMYVHPNICLLQLLCVHSKTVVPYKYFSKVVPMPNWMMLKSLRKNLCNNCTVLIWWGEWPQESSCRHAQSNWWIPIQSW